MEFVDAELAKEPAGLFMRFYIDKEDGGITLDELETFHRALQPLVEDVEYDYMEVSSPGADRPLRTQRDFERAMGQPVEVKLYRARDGAKRFEGILAARTEGAFTIRDASGREIGFTDGEVAQARPLIEVTQDDLEPAPGVPADEGGTER